MPFLVHANKTDLGDLVLEKGKPETEQVQPSIVKKKKKMHKA